MLDGKFYTTFSQAPVPPFDNFWEAVYYKNVEYIMMLCSFYDPKRGYQAEQYWPKQGQQALFSDKKLKVTNMGSKKLDDNFIETTFKIDGSDGVK